MGDTVEQLVSGFRRYGIVVGPAPIGSAAESDESSCPVLGWAASGAMSLTGWPGEAPQWPEGDVIGRLTGTAQLLGAIAQGCGFDLSVDVGAMLTGRAWARGSVRRGATSVGGHCQLVRAADSWVAINLARPGDLELLPALTDGKVSPEPTAVDPDANPDHHAAMWSGLREFARHRTGGQLAGSAQRLGIPAGELRSDPGSDGLPWTIHRLGESVRNGPRRPRVVDFSALWSGPLCAHLLGRCGARVVKVEDVGRPDGARHGDPWLFEQLHRHHDQLVLDFRNPTDHRALRALVDSADIVIEASRPRALAALGFSPAQFLSARPGRTWVSITGYGRSGPRSNWVAFGDDAAIAGGLVGRSGAPSPVFCADAVADPISGLCAATGALASIAQGGGHLVDCSMLASSAFVNRGGACHGDHRVEQHGSAWLAYHGDVSHPVEAPRPPAVPDCIRPEPAR